MLVIRCIVVVCPHSLLTRTPINSATTPTALVVHPWYLVRPISTIVRRSVEHGLVAHADRTITNLWRVIVATENKDKDWMDIRAEQLNSLSFMMRVCCVLMSLACSVFVLEMFVYYYY